MYERADVDFLYKIVVIRVKTVILIKNKRVFVSYVDVEPFTACESVHVHVPNAALKTVAKNKCQQRCFSFGIKSD